MGKWGIERPSRRKGLAKLLERRGKQFSLLELWQNAADEDGVTKVDLTLTPSAIDKDKYELTVEDDAPEGFTDITHAYTLFAESKKKGRADQRGRFNVGEKLVIATTETFRSTPRRAWATDLLGAMRGARLVMANRSLACSSQVLRLSLLNRYREVAADVAGCRRIWALEPS
jgi:hypothetical protein